MPARTVANEIDQSVCIEPRFRRRDRHHAAVRGAVGKGIQFLRIPYRIGTVNCSARSTMSCTCSA